MSEDGAIPSRAAIPSPKTNTMKKYKVCVCRQSYGFSEIEVIADSVDYAKSKALEESGDYEYPEKDADYFVEFVGEGESLDPPKYWDVVNALEEAYNQLKEDYQDNRWDKFADIVRKARG